MQSPRAAMERVLHGMNEASLRPLLSVLHQVSDDRNQNHLKQLHAALPELQPLPLPAPHEADLRPVPHRSVR